MDAEKRLCPACGYANRPNKRFCSGCGQRLLPVCPQCGTENEPAAQFCDECGSPITGSNGSSAHAPSISPITPAIPATSVAPKPPSALPSIAVGVPSAEERRLVTALFCDLVGFTPLSEHLDPEDVRDMQAQYFGAMSNQIERYGGIVEKYAGDAVLALFGTPVAHEDDAERAVLCALGMQTAISPVADEARQRWNVEPAIRVGVNTGEVVSGTWNASGRQDVAVTGDAVNTAARIQATAEPGETLVGIETMRLTRRRIRYGERRDVTLKGKVGTVPVYPALGLRERFGERWETSDHASPLVGRDREMVQLLDAWVRAQGGEGQVVTVIGEAGVGKSRLLAELVDRVAGSTAARVLRARCLSYGQQISLWLVADLLRSLFGITEQDDLSLVQGKLADALPEFLSEMDAGTQSEALDVVGEVLGLTPGSSMVASAGAQIRRQVLVRSLRLVLGTITQRMPTVIVLEDVHWIDEGSQDVLTELMSDVPGLRLLVLVAQRPGWNARWSEWGWTERITVRPLGEQEAAVLAGAVLGGLRLSPDLERYVADRAAGNPFFVEEMLRALQESAGLSQRDGVAFLAPGAAEHLPSTLTEVLLARLDRLDGQVKAIAQVGSVIGRSFAVRLLAQVMGQEQTALEPSLSALQQAEIAFPKRGSDLEYVFKHVTMREVAYNTLVQKRRQELHLKTARAIASLYPADEYVEMIAYHYARTEEHREAAEWLERAGDRAAGVYANETAIAQYREALKRLERIGSGSPTIARINEKLGAVLHTIARFDEALGVLEQAVDVYRSAKDLEALGRVTARIGRVHRDRGTVEEGIERLRPLLDLLAWSGPSSGLASLHVALAHLYFASGRYKESMQSAQQGAEAARAIGDDRLLAAAEMRRGTVICFLGRMREGIEVVEKAARLAEHAGDLDVLSIAVSNLGEMYSEIGELEQGRLNIERSLHMAERVGELASMGYSQVMIGSILYYQGRWDEAEGAIVRGGEVIRSVGSSSWYSAYPPLFLGRLKLAQGQWEYAAHLLQESVAIAEPIGDTQALQDAHQLLGQIEVLQGQANKALSRLTPWLGGAALPSHIELLTTLGWAQLEVGLVAEADESTSQAHDLAHQWSNRRLLPEVLRVHGMVLHRQDRWHDGEEAFKEAVRVARSLRCPYGEARALQQWGVLCVDSRNQGKGHEHLNEALSIFRRLGAQKDVEGTENMLAVRRSA